MPPGTPHYREPEVIWQVRRVPRAGYVHTIVIRIPGRQAEHLYIPKGPEAAEQAQALFWRLASTLSAAWPALPDPREISAALTFPAPTFEHVHKTPAGRVHLRPAGRPFPRDT